MPKQFLTLQRVLQDAAHANKQHGVTHIDKNGRCFYFQSYTNIIDSAEKVLMGLRKSGLLPGDAVLLQFHNNFDLIVAFWGCILGGFLPTPITTFSAHTNNDTEFQNFLKIWDFLDKPAIIVDASAKQIFNQRMQQPILDELRLVVIDELLLNKNEHNWHIADPHDLALNLLTSGSTGMPKCVQHTHSSIIARIIAMQQVMHFTPNEISLNWMPMEHVGGLVMFHVHDTYLGCQQINAKIEMFLAAPVNWILWMSQYKVTSTWAPNFAFSLVNKYASEIKKLAGTANLSSVKFILNGGEMVSYKDVQQFLEILTNLGLPANAIYPSYGMSETSSGITLANIIHKNHKVGVRIVKKNSMSSKLQYLADLSEEGVAFTEVGPPMPGVSFQVVDENNSCLPEDTIGQIQVQGPTLMHGYYKNPAANKEVFLKNGWFKTGDLGFLHEGRVVITGREKDVIIVNGAKHMNHEIEAAIEKYVAGIEKTFVAACGIPNQETGREVTVIFFVAIADKFGEQLKIVKAIKEAINRQVGIVVDHVIPIAKQNFPKTNSGKIQRTQLAGQFSSGEFQQIIQKIQLYSHDYTALPKWIYRKQWIKAPLQILPNENIDNFLIFADQCGFYEVIIPRLLAANKRVFVVKTGKNFKKINQYAYEIASNQPGDYLQLFTELSRSIKNLAIINLFDYEPQVVPYDIATFTTKQSNIVCSTLCIVQELIATAIELSCLFVVTTGAQEFLLKTNLQPNKATLIGLLRTLAKEFPHWYIKHLDFSGEDRDFPCDALLQELYTADFCQEVVYRRNERYICQLNNVEMNELDAQQEVWQIGGFYLITGGLGGVGYQLAQYLLDYYNAKLLIIGKTDLQQNHDKKAMYEILARKGSVIYANLDISQDQEIYALVKNTEAQYNCKLYGVLHLASLGLQDNFEDPGKHLIKNETIEYGQQIFAAKCVGTYILSQILSDYESAIFVIFSSVMSYLPQVGFGMYAAANACVDGFAYYHQIRNPGHKVRAISWSEWENIGMSQYNPFKNAPTRLGLQNISVPYGILSMEACLRLHSTATFVGLNSSFYPSIEGFGEKTELQQQMISDPIANLKVIPNDPENKLIKIWHNLLGPITIKDTSDFFECGGNSIAIFRLLELILQEFLVELPVKSIFENSKFGDLKKLVEYETSSLIS